MAFAHPEAKDLMGPLCLSCVLLSSDSFLALSLLCSALSHRDDGPCSLHFLGSCISGLPSRSPVEAAGGRRQGRRKGEARMLVSLPLCLGQPLCPLCGSCSLRLPSPMGTASARQPLQWFSSCHRVLLLGSASTTSSCFRSTPSQGCITLAEQSGFFG